MKKILEISFFYFCASKIMIRWRMVNEIRCVTDVIVIPHLGLCFSLLPPWEPKKIKFWKNKEKLLEISSFYIYVPKFTIGWSTVPEIYSATDGQMDGRTDERTDRRKKWYIEVNAPCKRHAFFTTHKNQDKKGLDRRWKACPKVKLHGLISRA